VSGVFCVDLKNIKSKATDLQNALKVMSGDKYSFVSQALNVGLDYSKQAYFFFKSNFEISQSYTAGFLPLSDAKQFKKILQKSIKNNNIQTSIKRKEGWEYVIAENQAILLWNKKQALMILQNDKSDEEKLWSFAQKIIKTPQSEALETKNQYFKEILQQNFDACYWLNPELTLPKLPNFIDSYFNFKSLPKLIDGYSGIINFEKGEIITQHFNTYNQESFTKYKNILKTNYDQNIIKNIPLENPLMISGFAFNMRGLETILDNMKLLEKLKIQVSLLDMKIEDFFTILSGDIAIAFNDIHAKNPQKSEFLIALGLEKQGIFDKILGEIASFGLIKKKKGFYIFNQEDSQIYLIEKEKTLYITYNEDLKDKIVNNQNKKSDKISQITGNQSLLFYLNYQKLNENLSKMNLKDNFSFYPEALTQSFLNEFENLTIQADPWGNIKHKTTIQLKLNNKSRNAINVLGELLERLMKEVKPNI
jgi:predicted GIY-YIG superfamily endonuclease